MSILGMLRKTMKRGLNSVRRVGKASRSIARRGTNAVGLTRRRKAKRGSRRR
jgi:hypothetical protein